MASTEIAAKILCFPLLIVFTFVGGDQLDLGGLPWVCNNCNLLGPAGTG